MKYPDYVIVDTQDGTMFGKDAYGHLWTEGTAFEFTEKRNRELKVPTYKVYGLTEVDLTDRQQHYDGDGSFADNH